MLKRALYGLRRWMICAAAVTLAVGLGPIRPCVAQTGPEAKGTSADSSQSRESSGKLEVDPAKVLLSGRHARQTLLVSRPVDGHRMIDATRRVRYQSAAPEVATVDEQGVITAVTDGRTEITIESDGIVTKIPVEVVGTTANREYNFERDIVPILSRYGCNSSGCHGKAEGQNGFKLSVFGFDPSADYEALLHEGRGRRISLVRPDASLLLTKASGGVPHGGGLRIPRDSVEYGLLADWISSGAQFGQPDDPQVIGIELSPADRPMSPGEQQQLRVMATYEDGHRSDVTALTRFQSNNEGLATVAETGLVTVGQTPGDVAIMAAFMGQVDVYRVLIPQQVDVAQFSWPAEQNFIDPIVDAKLQKLGIVPSDVCSDADFLRRASIDITGTLPTADETRAFLADDRADKRQRLVDELLQRPEYADYWALKWSDLLRVDRQKLGHRGAYEMSSWIRNSFAENIPADQFAREILTAEGLLSERPAGHLYKVVTKPGEVASTISQVLLGVRIECAQCHHHPFDRWSQQDYTGMQAFFVQTSFKKTPRGEMLVARLNANDPKHPRTGQPVPAYPLGSSPDQPSPEGDRRQLLAEWMTGSDNPWFARNYVNRTWAHFTGRGVVEPVDDVRLTNPPSNPDLLDALAAHFIDSGFDVHDLIRTITASRTYQLSSTPNGTNQQDEQNYSRALLRPLEAEVLLDAVCQTTGVPEKFDGFPVGYRAIQLWDSHVPSEFLKAFGRPTRSTACTCERISEPSVAQVLKTMNSPDIQSKLSHAGGRIATWNRSTTDNRQLIDELYLTIFARRPMEAEVEALHSYLAGASDRRQAIEDIVWTMLNSTEFVFNH